MRDELGRFKTGNIMDDKTRAKISKSMKGKQNSLGRKLSQEHKDKISAANKGHAPYYPPKSGDEHWNWQGGITNENESQRVKFKQTIRLAVLERDSYTCTLCEQQGGDLQVDHIQSWADYPKQRFDVDNCRTLCTKCHYKLTYGKDMPETTKTWGHNVPRRVKS